MGSRYNDNIGLIRFLRFIFETSKTLLQLWVMLKCKLLPITCDGEEKATLLV